MNRLILLLLFPLYVHGDDLYKPTILSINSEYPIEMNEQNRANLAKEQQDVEKMFQSKIFPWEYILGPLLVALLFYIAQQQPEKEEEIEKQLKKRQLISRNKALNALRELSKENLPQVNEFDRYYEKITFIIREYIEEYYSIDAPKETTEEFLRNITSHPVFNKNTEANLAEFLKSADRVKFSEHISTLQECAKAQKTAEDFVSNPYS
jgi:hypothetical protein